MHWSVASLDPRARVVSASRRTDIPALYCEWFLCRLEAGYADYIPAGPPRRYRASLLPQDVLWVNLWTRWPRPFLPALERLLARRFPVLVNLTITGLGDSPVEPGSPPADRALAAARELCERLPAGAVLWRYDPVFLSRRYDHDFHLENFQRLADGLAGLVDRAVISFVTPYGRRVAPDLRAYERDAGDRLVTAPEPRLALASALASLSAARGLRLCTCCDEPLQHNMGLSPAGCNQHGWACRAWPELAAVRAPRPRPTRPGCACCLEVDIGCYDSCTLGCRYSYGSRNRATALQRTRSHDPEGSCLVALNR